MRRATDHALLALLATTLLDGQQAAAEKPPNDAKCYHMPPSLIPSVGGQSFDCALVDYYCPDHADTFWSENQFVSGSIVKATGGDATIGAGSTHTETSGWIIGGGGTGTM